MSKIRILSAALLYATIALSSGDPVRAQNLQGTDVVIHWNQLLQSTLPATAGLASNRYFAALHVAIFDAVNAIERRYTPFLSSLPGSAGASAEAAAAKAARDVLAWLIPGSQATYDAALAAQLAGIPPGLAQEGLKMARRRR